MTETQNESVTARKDMIERCHSDIQILMREAKDAQIPMNDVVIVVADRQDTLGGELAQACERLGNSLDGATRVCVLGIHRNFARELIASIHIDAAMLLDDEPPVSMAHLFCFAHGGFSAVVVGLSNG